MNIGTTFGSDMNNLWSRASQQMADAGQRLAGVTRDASAETTERAIENPGEVAEATVDLQEGKQLTLAAGKLLETQQANLGALIDTSA